MPGDMRRFVDRFDRRPGVKEDAVAKSEKQLGVKLPSEYLEFLKFTNGGEGFIGKGDYLMLWSVEELVPLNQSYEVQNLRSWSSDLRVRRRRRSLRIRYEAAAMADCPSALCWDGLESGAANG